MKDLRITKIGWILLIQAFLTYSLTEAQTVNFSWATRTGNTFEDRGNSIATDKYGNVYTAGNFKGTVDFDPGANNFSLTADVSNGDIFITKTDPAGNLIWAIQFKGKSREDRPVIHVDTLGHIYCAGQFAGDTMDADPGPGTYYLTNTDLAGVDMFVAKLDTSGTLIWAKLLNGDGGFYNYPFAIRTDAAGNVFTAGSFSSTFDFDPGLDTFQLSTIPTGLEDVFVLKLDAGGNFIWAKQMGGNRPDGANSMEIDGSGNIYTTGYFGGTADFDPGPGVYDLVAAPDNQMFLSKLDASGNFIWAKQISGTLGLATGYAIIHDQQRSIYISGLFGGSIDFDPGAGNQVLTTPGDYDPFILKTDTAGNFLCVKRIGGSGGGTAFYLAFDSAYNLYLAGSLQDTMDFDPGSGVYNLVSTSGSVDVFICKLDSSGSFKWANKVGGSASDWVMGLSVDPASNIFLAGYFSGTADFNPGAGTNNLVSAGSDDIFLVKLGQSPATFIRNNEFAGQVKIYPNPSNGLFRIDLGTIIPDIRITVFDMGGKTVFSKAYSDAQWIDLPLDQADGAYLLHLTADEQEAAWKILKY